MRALAAGAVLAPFLLIAAPADGAPEWPQWGANPAHTGTATAAAQPLQAILADFVYDPFVPAAQAEAGGDLLAHYPVPLLDGPDVYMETKTGHYTSCIPPGSGRPAPCGAAAARDTEIWNVQKLSWRGSALVPVWRFETDWKPEPDQGHLSGWEPVFHPVLAGGFVWAPGSGGSVYRIDPATGLGIRIAPLAAGVDPNIFVAGGLAAAGNGNVYFNALRLDSADPWGADASGAWLVEVRPDGSFRTAAFADLIPGAPRPDEPCENPFASSTLPFPPAPDAAPPTAPCGSQRPGINAIPAIGGDGTIFTVSRAHFSDRSAYLVAVDPVLLGPRWAASMRDRLADGCGVLLPPNGTPGGCRVGTAAGVDPETNRAPAGRVVDLASSSPVVLPDGGVLYGTYTRYNFDRGHLMRFDASGTFRGSYDFGWDITPAVFPHDGRYSVILKDNHYELGSYCFNSQFCPPEAGQYDVVSLDPSLTPEWTFRSTNTESCARAADGTISCISDHPDGFEWCVNQPAVDVRGVVYANSEDGFLYAIGTDGKLSEKIFLNLAIGAAYTPLSIGADGTVYTQNDGHLFAVGYPQRAVPVRPARPRPPRTIGPRAKHAAPSGGD